MYKSSLEPETFPTLRKMSEIFLKLLPLHDLKHYTDFGIPNFLSLSLSLSFPFFSVSVFHSFSFLVMNRKWLATSF